MSEVTTIGLDLAKNVFQAHGASSSGEVVFRRRLRREQVMRFFADQPRCLVAMEACASSHFWARAISELGHDARLIPPAYVKPFVKRQKNDMADAEAICEAVQRPTMRFVAVKSEAKQASAVIFRTRDLLVGQRTQIINALRGHMGEFAPPMWAGLLSRSKTSRLRSQRRLGRACYGLSSCCEVFKLRSRLSTPRSPRGPSGMKHLVG